MMAGLARKLLSSMPLRASFGDWRLISPKIIRSSQLQSGLIQVPVVVHLLLQGFSVSPLVQ